MYLRPDILDDANYDKLNVSHPDAGTELVELTRRLGVISSRKLRMEMSKEKFSQAAYFEKLLADENDAEMKSSKFEYTDNPDTNLMIKLSYKVKQAHGAGSFFQNISRIKTYDKNPLIAAWRTCPVEYYCKSNYVTHITYVFPHGWEVGELPKPRLITLGENALAYQRDINYIPEINSLTVSSIFKRDGVSFAVEDYDNLKTFCNEVLNEENKVVEVKLK